MKPVEKIVSWELQGVEKEIISKIFKVSKELHNEENELLIFEPKGRRTQVKAKGKVIKTINLEIPDTIRSYREDHDEKFINVLKPIF